jgi:hypothetical protein
MKGIKDNLITGLLCGFVAPAIVFLLYSKIKQPDDAVADVIREFVHLKIVTVILSFAAFVNLIFFFIFIWIRADKSARGVLIATIVYAFIVIILKLTS